jgi:hypothetical protein
MFNIFRNNSQQDQRLVFLQAHYPLIKSAYYDRSQNWNGVCQDYLNNTMTSDMRACGFHDNTLKPANTLLFNCPDFEEKLNSGEQISKLYVIQRYNADMIGKMYKDDQQVFRDLLVWMIRESNNTEKDRLVAMVQNKVTRFPC